MSKWDKFEQKLRQDGTAKPYQVRQVNAALDALDEIIAVQAAEPVRENEETEDEI